MLSSIVQCKTPLRKRRIFSALLAALPGIGPTDALRALESRSGDPHAQRLLTDAHKSGKPNLPFDQVAALPLPHPLDMEWRFTGTTAGGLLANAIAATRDGEAILLLGVPSVAAAAASTTVDRTFLVTGEGNVICKALEQATKGDPRFVHQRTEHRAAAAIVRSTLVPRRLCGDAGRMQPPLRGWGIGVAGHSARRDQALCAVKTDRLCLISPRLQDSPSRKSAREPATGRPCSNWPPGGLPGLRLAP